MTSVKSFINIFSPINKILYLITLTAVVPVILIIWTHINLANSLSHLKAIYSYKINWFIKIE